MDRIYIFSITIDIDNFSGQDALLRRNVMTNVVKFYIFLFAIMFFWVYSVDAFALRLVCSPPSSAGIVECVDQDGNIVIIGK